MTGSKGGDDHTPQPDPDAQSELLVRLDYTNWRGERRKYLVLPVRVIFSSNTWHPEKQWLLEALDVKKSRLSTFAVQQIHSWEPATSQPKGPPPPPAPATSTTKRRKPGRA